MEQEHKSYKKWRVSSPEFLQNQSPEVRLLNTKNEEELLSCINILNSENNKPHLAGAPKNPEELKAKAETLGKHVLVVTSDKGEIAGMGILNDAGVQENDNMISTVAVREDLQRLYPRATGDQSVGYGRRLMEGLVKFGFSTAAADGRERVSIHTAIVMFVDGWERMYGLDRHLGFEPKVVWGDNYILPDGKTRDTIRLELKKNTMEHKVRQGAYSTITSDDLAFMNPY